MNLLRATVPGTDRAPLPGSFRSGCTCCSRAVPTSGRIGGGGEGLNARAPTLCPHLRLCQYPQVSRRCGPRGLPAPAPPVPRPPRADLERELGAGLGDLRSTWTPVRHGWGPRGGRCRSGPGMKALGTVPSHPRAASDGQARVPRPGVGRVARESGGSARTQRATPGGDPPRQLYSALHPPRSPRVDAEPQGREPGPAAGRGPGAPERTERSSGASPPPTPHSDPPSSR